MLFNSLAFAVFAPLFFALYFVTRGRARLLLTLFASYFFYAWWDWRFVSLLLISTVVDYFVCLKISKSESSRQRKGLLIVSLCSNLGILGVFKYFDFFSVSLASLFEQIGWSVSLPTLNVILPVGISFYTFQTLSYTIDVYRGRLDAETDFWRFAVYVSLFPQLVAGPIVRASHLLPQLKTDARPQLRAFGVGIEMVVWGFFLKTCLADTAAVVVNPRCAVPDFPEPTSHIAGVLCFAFQIYGDFAGYSLIAIGLGRVMGLDLGVNFNRPYFSSSFSEFWQRWHISLSSWLRDYLYISLGGNRRGRARTVRNLILTMVLGGLWHGAGWTFVIWGVLHGLYLAIARILGPGYFAVVKALRVPRFASKAFLIFVVFAATNLAWIFFRAESVDDALTIIFRICEFDGFQAIGAGEQRIALLKTAMFVLIVVSVDALGLVARVREFYQSRLVLRFCGALALTWMILLQGTFEGASFIYFQF